MKSESSGSILSAVLVDYDNIYLSLKRKSEEAAKRFAKDCNLWLKEIESGRLITATNGSSYAGQRRIVMSRCYGNPVPRRNSGDNSTDMNSFPFIRHHFLRAGFESIDCPPLTAQLKNSADIRMVMDVRDYLNHETRFEEFIILSGDADFTPVLHRLRAHARRTVVFANDHTAAPYTAISDGEVRESDLIALLLEGRIGSVGETKIAGELRGPVSSAELDVLRKEIVAEVAASVRSAAQPVPLEALADRAVRALGHDKTVGSSWGGAGTFRDLLSKNLPADIKVTDQAPFYAFETTRQVARELEARPELRDRRLEAPSHAPVQAQVSAQAHPQAHPQALAPAQSSWNDGRFDQRPLQSEDRRIEAQRSDGRQDAGRDDRAGSSADFAGDLPAPRYERAPLASEQDRAPLARGEPSLPVYASAAPQQQAPRAPLPQSPVAPQHERQPAERIPAERQAARQAAPAPAQAAPQAPRYSMPPQQAPNQQYGYDAMPSQRAPAPQVAPRGTDTAAQIQQSIARIHEACQAPPLSPPEYRVLFEVMAEEINANNLSGAQTLVNIAQRALELGLEVRRDDVRFVLEVVSEADPWFEQGASANLFASRFRNFVVARCRSQGLSLSADEIDLVDAWFGGAAPSQRVAAQAPSYKQQPQAGSADQTAAQAPSRVPAGDRWAQDGVVYGQAQQPQGFANQPDDEFPRIVRSRLRG
ncbi:MAG: NYN domain-containing protein [Hyphomicrobium sp.]|jgi:hypothetical protein